MDNDLAWFDCPCGEPHLLPAQPLLWLAAELGPLITVTVPPGSWRVPRVWIAAHGLKAAELPDLATARGWEQAG